MKVFVAGATGAIGRFLVPHLLENGHDVIGIVRSTEKARTLEAVGAKAVIADALNKADLKSAIRKSEPEVVIHELTALARFGNFKKFDQELALTNRFRTEVTETLLDAARMVGANRFIAQSFCGWPFAREGTKVKSEEDPLEPNPPASMRRSLAAIRFLEDTIRNTSDLQALALRYGFLYGPGTGISKEGSIVNLIRRRKMPIVGDGAGIWSFIHVQDAARVTAIATLRGAPGIYNIVDDEPAPVSTWLPFLAEAIGAKPPRRIPVWLGKLLIGDAGVSMMTRIRGGSNAKAKHEFRWKPIYASWRQGFIEGLD